MAFDVVTSSFQVKEKKVSPLRRTVTTGLIFGVVYLYFAVVGILLMFDGRWIIADVLTLGQAVLILIGLGAGIQIARKTTARGLSAVVLQGLGAGVIAGAVLALLVVVMSLVKLRFMFVALSPPLFKMLTFGLSTPVAVALLIGLGAVLGVLGALLYITPRAARRPVMIGLVVTAFIGLFQELIQLLPMMQSGGIMTAVFETLFTWDGLKLESALGIFAVVAAGVFIWGKSRQRALEPYKQLSPAGQRSVRLTGMLVLGLLLLVVFPLLGGSFIGQVYLLVGLYILMGMGLNLEIGLAGLLDLGFVAFFAVGAYTTALLTADSPHALAAYTILPALSWWEAMPIAVLMALIVGVLFGVPVLRIRGDYLAVATLGLGEIIRVVVLSDMAAPLLGGAQGILEIPRPRIGALLLDDQVELYFICLGSAAVAGYIAWRLENSRLGRAWTAVRDDEDVAQALGINLVNVKLLAYGLGAAFAGLAGSIFAVMLTSIFPHSFQLLISINVLALIIVGGMGSLPGVAVGAAALIGLPELLREFGEYRFLFYGAAIVIMMRIRPEGLWPSAARRRELRDVLETDKKAEPEAVGHGLATTSPAQGQTPASRTPDD